MNWARKFRVRAVSVRALVAALEVIARRNPGKAPEIIARVRKLERMARFADRRATSIGKEGCQSDRGSTSPFHGRSSW